MEIDLASLPDKKYFSMGEASNFLGVKDYILRYWEKEFKNYFTVKRISNRRMFQKSDLVIFLKIKELSEYSKRKEEIIVNLEEQKITFGNNEIDFEIDQFKKKCLIEGLDDIALSLEKNPKITEFEKKLSSNRPWIFND